MFLIEGLTFLFLQISVRKQEMFLFQFRYWRAATLHVSDILDTYSPCQRWPASPSSMRADVLSLNQLARRFYGMRPVSLACVRIAKHFLSMSPVSRVRRSGCSFLRSKHTSGTLHSGIARLEVEFTVLDTKGRAVDSYQFPGSKRQVGSFFVRVSVQYRSFPRQTSACPRWSSWGLGHVVPMFLPDVFVLPDESLSTGGFKCSLSVLRRHLR